MSDLAWLSGYPLSVDEKEVKFSRWVGRMAELGREDRAERLAGLLVMCDWKEDGVVASVRAGVGGE
jgi:hypothetical protein